MDLRKGGLAENGGTSPMQSVEIMMLFTKQRGEDVGIKRKRGCGLGEFAKVGKRRRRGGGRDSVTEASLSRSRKRDQGKASRSSS